VAVKQPLCEITKKEREDLKAEATMLARVWHPHCLRFRAICMDPSKLMLITNYADKGSLHDVLANGSQKPAAKERVTWATQLSQAIAFLHYREKPRGIIHGSLTSRNLLLDRGNKMRVADFGLAAMKDKLTSSKSKNTQNNPNNLDTSSLPEGNLPYMAPELFTGLSPSRHSDVFAMGIVFYELAFDLPPSIPENQAFHGARAGVELEAEEMYEQQSSPKSIPKQYFRAVQGMTDKSMRDRPDADRISDTIAKIDASFQAELRDAYCKNFEGIKDSVAVVSLISEVGKWQAIAKCCKQKKLFFCGFWQPELKESLEWRTCVKQLYDFNLASKMIIIGFDLERDGTILDENMRKHQVPYLMEAKIPYEQTTFIKFMTTYGNWR